jgi:branched-chain amino acid aminotransferase
MNECFGRNFILNGELKSVVDFDPALVYEGDSVYEVIRMMNGNPVFFCDHYERLTTSVRCQGREMLANSDILRKAIITLTRSDKKKEINLKIIFNYNNDTWNFLVYFIEPVYPSAMQYRSGVKGILFNAEREDPESKVINHKLRTSIYHRLILGGAYEALLVNEQGMITEGSRSNIFFVKGDELFTAPDKLVLGGITRKYVLDICKEKKIDVVLKCVSVADLHEFQAVFMTGTSPMVLPFNQIDDIVFDPGLPVISELRELYAARAEESIKDFVSE